MNDSHFMTIENAKIALTVSWVLAMAAIAYGANATFSSNWIALVSFTLIPPIVLWRFWNEPPQSMSERIREARR